MIANATQTGLHDVVGLIDFFCWPNFVPEHLDAPIGPDLLSCILSLLLNKGRGLSVVMSVFDLLVDCLLQCPKLLFQK